MSFLFFIHWGRKKIRLPIEDSKNSLEKEIALLLGSTEITLPKNDIIALNLDSPIDINSSLQRIIEEINRKNGLSILSHPSYLLKPYFRKKLLKLRNFLGIEIYNPGKIPWPESTGRWDYILSHRYGDKVWGFASDDMHDLKRDAGRAWIMVKGERKDEASIIEALKKGSFYSTTGVFIEDIILEDGCLYIKLNDICKIRFFGYGHKVLQINFGKEAKYSLSPEDRYVRIEVKSLGNRKKAWTQPIFVNKGEVVYFPYSFKGEWLKGCIHIHTKFDGGTAELREVVNWYKRHGYDFLAITEHNYIAHPKKLINI